ncbi:proline-, glutamic acid- and leucine-rich protein 1-like [Phalaenopsis equestris]|uniref:proline-, glutamic acid- and leucine-rich protein 1-like n=1 Tax=Phalaenopsis equestris TaxID=78828 RepID=UPI0009E3E1BA|nr:proline-, glutamic acid- and leucine-rich protein 1-like [Phalaenopsis equestris]
MLPKVKGDGDSWFLIIQKILIAINSLLTDAFQGLEEEKKSLEVMKLIVPPGKDLPPPLGGQTSLEEASEPVMRKLSELLVPRVTTLMHSCCIMLTNSYSFPVLIPARPLLATVGRVLQMDGSFGGSLFPLTSSLHQELLCAELPALHLGSLDLLIAIIKGLRSQLLPHSANVVRLLTEYFRKTRMPSIRRKVYLIVQMLLISMGVGMTIYLSQEVISNAFADLADNLELRSSPVLSNMQPSIFVGETFQQNYDKKRKRTSIIPAEHPNGFDSSSKICSKESEAPLSVKIAALKTLEALLTMGGSLRSETWRRDVDRLVINVATNACDVGWANEDKSSLVADESSFADFQLAALEALLASLLSPTETRPPYLSQGLNLFQRGRRETGSKIATFCAHALLALEVLIHPRALPLTDHLPPTNQSVDAGFNNVIKTNLKGDLELLDEEDELSSAWFDKNDDQILPDSRNLNDKTNETTQKSPNPTEDITTKAPAINVQAGSNLSGSEIKFSQNVDEFTADRDKTETSSHNASHNKMDFGQGSLAISIAEMEPGKTASPSGITANLRNHGSDVIKLSVDDIKEDSAHKISPDLFRDRDAKLFYYDSDSVSLDSLPSIVDGDPDSE